MPERLPAPRLYPVALNLQGKPCLVVGGGRVALRKTQGLVEAGALVRVVAPEIHPELSAMADHEQVQILPRGFQPGDALGMALVFAATDSAEVNDAVVAAARQQGTWTNRADQPEDCDFTGMSVVARGSLLVAISTGAESPAAARWIREQVEKQFGPEYGEFLDLLGSLRSEVKESLPEADRAEAWRRAVQSRALEQLREGDRAGAERLLRSALGLNS